MITVLVGLNLIVFSAGAVPLGGRIVNGSDAQEGEFPYIVSLRFEGVGHTCGASIINAEWVLTAAHCVYQRDPTGFTVQFGVLSSLPDVDHMIPVKTVVMHPDYLHNETLGVPNDVAVLELASPLTFSNTVRPVTLPSSDSAVLAGSSAVLSGWGDTSYRPEGAVAAEHLQRADLIVYDDEYCEIFHPYDPVMLTNRLYHLCAGVPEGGKGQCSGDSGGPLVVNGEQVGIVSFSQKPCGLKGYPGVFTKVPHYVQWIVGVSSSGRLKL